MVKLYLHSDQAHTLQVDQSYYINGHSLEKKTDSEIYDFLIDAVRNKENYLEIAHSQKRIFLPKDSILYVEQNSEIKKEDLEKVFWSFL